MADPYGIEIGLKAAFGMVLAMSRGTNRTEDLVRMLQDSDTVVCLSIEDANNIRARCAQHNKSSNCWIVPSEKMNELFVHRRPYGAIYFTELWIEDYYKRAIQKAADKLNEAQRLMEVRIKPQQFEPRTRQGETIRQQLSSYVPLKPFSSSD